MKRRGFLQILGGAFAAPLMPSVSFGAATSAAYPASALHVAIYHAKSRVNFSVFSLSRHLGLDLGQAERLMSDLSSRGILGPLQGRTQSGRWALSKVWERPIVDAAAAQNLARNQNAKTKAAQSPARAFDQAKTANPAETDTFLLLPQIYQTCRAQGHALYPHCANLAA